MSSYSLTTHTLQNIIKHFLYYIKNKICNINYNESIIYLICFLKSLTQKWLSIRH